MGDNHVGGNGLQMGRGKARKSRAWPLQELPPRDCHCPSLLQFRRLRQWQCSMASLTMSPPSFPLQCPLPTRLQRLPHDKCFLARHIPLPLPRDDFFRIHCRPPPAFYLPPLCLLPSCLSRLARVAVNCPEIRFLLSREVSLLAMADLCTTARLILAGRPTKKAGCAVRAYIRAAV